MVGYSILNELFTNILQTKFVKEIYHSVILKRLDDSGTKPVAPVNGRFRFVGMDDKEGFTCYCRQTGSADVTESEKLGGCNSKKYRFQVPTRLVFFNQSEVRSHDDIISKLVGAVIKTNKIRVQKIINLPEDILRAESPTAKATLTEDSFYVAIDFFLLLDLQTDTCQEEIKCDGVPNPFCLPG